MEISFAKSMTGHDRNQIYAVYGMDDKFVFLVNGTTKTIASPKKKSRKHIQIIQNLPKEVKECFAIDVTDVTLKRAIKTYRKILKDIED